MAQDPKINDLVVEIFTFDHRQVDRPGVYRPESSKIRAENAPEVALASLLQELKRNLQKEDGHGVLTEALMYAAWRERMKEAAEFLGREWEDPVEPDLPFLSEARGKYEAKVAEEASKYGHKKKRA